MNKYAHKVFLVIIIIVIFAVLNMPVTTRQGINYEWKGIRLPLYLKVLNFFDRHFNYQNLTQSIIKDKLTQKDKVLALFAWTNTNIREVPRSFPVMDDHVWYTIVRGYGKPDQVSYVFVTLCNYAGLNAFYTKINSGSEHTILSFVKLNKEWVLLDPYRGNYFQDSAGNLVPVKDLKNNDWRIKSISGSKSVIDYKEYFKNLPDMDNLALYKASVQSPMRRFIFETKKWLSRR